MAGFCIATWEKGVLQYCLLAGNCIAIQLCQAGLKRQGLYRNTVQSIVTGDKGKRLGYVAIQHSQPRTRRCYARSKARGGAGMARAHAHDTAALRCDTTSWGLRHGRPGGHDTALDAQGEQALALGVGAQAEARGACRGDAAIRQLSLRHDQGLGHDTAGSRSRYDWPWPRYGRANEP